MRKCSELKQNLKGECNSNAPVQGQNYKDAMY